METTHLHHRFRRIEISPALQPGIVERMGKWKPGDRGYISTTNIMFLGENTAVKPNSLLYNAKKVIVRQYKFLALYGR